MSTVLEILHKIETLPEQDRRILIEKLMQSAPKAPRKFKTWIGKSSTTGLPVMESESGAPQVTSAEVRALLADFP